MAPGASGAEPAGLEGTGMSDTENQQEWLDGQSPADDWDAHITKRVLDELFCFARQYRKSESFHGLLKFVAGVQGCHADGLKSGLGNRHPPWLYRALNSETAVSERSGWKASRNEARPAERQKTKDS